MNAYSVLLKKFTRNANSPCDRGYIGIKMGTKHVIHQKLTNVMYNSVLTDLKVSSLARICVFNRPEHNAKGELLGM